MNRNAALSALIALAVICTSIASAGDTVYVSERNGAAYHAADCPRLRFPVPMSLHDASQRYQRCPVCKGKASKVAYEAAIAPSSPESMVTAQPNALPATQPTSISVPAPDGLAPARLSRPEPTSDHPSSSHRRGPGRARWVGAVIGGLAGFAGGLAFAIADCTLGCVHEGRDNALMAGLTIVGAVGGYALGGGFSKHSAAVDRALERDRAAIRTAHAERHVAEQPGDEFSSAARSVLSASGRPITN